ncbi:MAG TPA: hypothetical protein DC046_16725 [Rhodospirillaceae bacterium]|nr:hypothetical protein [Rhodospirillaceae bacterium]
MDAGKLLDDVLAAAAGTASVGVDSITDFAKDYAQDIAEYSALIAKGAAPGGWIDEEDLPGWTKSLKTMVREFARMVAALIVVAVEKIINAVLSVIRTAIEGVIGAGRLAFLGGG